MGKHPIMNRQSVHFVAHSLVLVVSFALGI